MFASATAQTVQAAPITEPRVTAPIAPASGMGPNPKGYSFDLTLDPGKRLLTGTGSIELSNDQDQPLTEIYLRTWANLNKFAAKGASANLTDVKFNGEPANLTNNGTVMRVELARPLNPGETGTLNFGLGVATPENMGRFGKASDGTLYFGNALPTLAVRDAENWNLDPYVWRGESFYTRSSNWNVTLHAPADQQLITSGSASAENVQEGVRTIEVKAPNVRDFLVVAAKDYEKQSKQVDDTTVNVWTSKADAAKGAKMLNTATRSLAFFNGRYGKYEYPELNVIATKGMGGGMEYPNVTLNDTNFGGNDTVVAHENAHQFFYGMIGNNEYDDPWLDESFASFATDEYFRDIKQSASGLPLIGKRAKPIDHNATGKLHLPSDDFNNPKIAPEGRANISSPMHDLVKSDYFGTVYGNGPRVIYQLKKDIGAESFDAGMRTWFANKKFGIATTAEYIQTMSEAAGKDLTQWFADHSIQPVEPSADTKLDPNGSM